MMVTCPNCRTEAETGARFCGTCGYNLERAQAAERAQSAPEERPYEPTPGERYAPSGNAPAPPYPQPQRDQYPPRPQYQQPAYSQQPSGQHQQYPPYPSYPQYQYGGRQKSVGAAAVLAFILGLFGIMGIGHLYVGRLTRGFLILAAGLVLAAVVGITAFLGFASPAIWGVTLAAGIGLVLLWIWQTYDAYRLANEYNYSIQRSGRPAW